MGRQIRRVPENWEHPRKSNGEYQPMYDKFYLDAISKWIEEHNQWMAGTHPDQLKYPEETKQLPFFAMWNGSAPDVDYYHEVKYTEEQLTHIQLYETTSEGTPVSPVFRADQIDELCEYAAEHCTTFADFKASKEKWKEMLTEGIVHHQMGGFVFI